MVSPETTLLGTLNFDHIYLILTAWNLMLKTSTIILL